MTEDGPRRITGFPRTRAFSGMVWKVTCVECGESLQSPVAIVSDGKNQLAYCSRSAWCAGQTPVREYSLGDETGHALIPPERAMEFQEIRKWRRENREREKAKTTAPAGPASSITEDRFSVPFMINEGAVTCPICGAAVHLKATFTGPTAQPATIHCPHCERMFRVELAAKAPRE